MARVDVTARWLEHGAGSARVEAARPRHATVDFGLTLLERDSSIGGGLLAGALAYRLFILLLPTALLFVSGLGLYAGAADKSTSQAARETGLHGLIASQVALDLVGQQPLARLSPDGPRRALRDDHPLPCGRGRPRDRLAWIRPGRTRHAGGDRAALARILLALVSAQIAGWIRRHDQLGGAAALLVYLVLAGGAWLLVSLKLPHRDVRWQALLPGAALVGVGLLFVNVFNVYVTTRLVENRADTYGALGIAAALLLSLVIVGRLIVLSAELNALLASTGASVVRRWCSSALVAVAALGACATARGSAGDEQALAKRYAPVVRLVEQKEECGPGEPYQPLDVNALFGQPTVALRGPWNAADLVKIGPTAKRSRARALRLPPRLPGRRALARAAATSGGPAASRRATEPTVYAHVATDPAHPGRLALQYWFFYVYNDWNNLHEGDWEMIQLDFDAANAGEALAKRPTSVGYSQHEGAEQATWGDDKLQLVDGTHPVVVPGGRLARELLRRRAVPRQLGRAGRRLRQHDRPARRPCARRSRRSRAIRPRRGAEFPWIDFQGRWGELQPAFFNGPTGPNLKTQWTEPITWSEGWRDQSLTVPAGSAFGTAATDFFCRAIGNGSRALVQLVHRPLQFTLLLAAAGAAAHLLPLANLVAPRRAVSPGAPARVGPDPRGRGARVRGQTGADARDRRAVHPDRAADGPPAGARRARDRRPRRGDR